MLQLSRKQYGLPRLLHPAAAPNLRLPATEFARSPTFTVRQRGGRRMLSLSRFVVHIFRPASKYQKATRIEIVDSPLPRFLGFKVGSKVPRLQLLHSHVYHHSIVSSSIPCQFRSAWAVVLYIFETTDPRLGRANNSGRTTYTCTYSTGNSPLRCTHGIASVT